ncbi:hypothetical protein ABVK25_011980 [Lepraria finkii]|uniref:Ras-GAP domain-containing protein n=1 Tax=Lepraria finkii TaxID=1340010 RepID=A0ABR4AJC4_9LECA
MAEIDSLLQTVMFTIYGNQYESREEHLLLTMFQSVLTHQFETTPEYSSLLRQNTPVSRMMTTYTRRGPGQSYLKEIMAEKINGLTELADVDLEINPLKVYETMVKQIEDNTGALPDDLPRSVTAEFAAENAQVQAIITPRLKMLTEIAEGFLSTIIEALEDVPHICTLLIGGFFFLRFINPAIVTPKIYLLLERVPEEKPKRRLTYIAKMRQNLANKPSYAKEPYMAKLQPFIQRNKDRVNKFLLELCEVQDFYESLELDNYVALSKRDTELSISLNECYATHALLEKHNTELAKDPSSHLGMILQELEAAHHSCQEKDNRAIHVAPDEVYFMEAKSAFVQIMRSLPHNASVTKRPLKLEFIAKAAGQMKDPVMVRKGIRCMELLNTLSEMQAIDRGDDYAILRDEIEQELAHLGRYATTNTYLLSQLDTYKSYLHNVRSQSEGTRRGKEVKVKELGPYKFTHAQLEKDGVIVRSNVPENRRGNIFFMFRSPLAGTFIISLHYKKVCVDIHTFIYPMLTAVGRARGLFELDLKLDDLLEMQKDGQDDLDLEYVQFDVSKVLSFFLNKTICSQEVEQREDS